MPEPQQIYEIDEDSGALPQVIVDAKANTLVFVHAHGRADTKHHKAWFSMALYKNGVEVKTIITAVNHENDQREYSLFYSDVLPTGRHRFHVAPSAAQADVVGSNQGLIDASVKTWYINGVSQCRPMGEAAGAEAG